MTQPSTPDISNNNSATNTAITPAYWCKLTSLNNAHQHITIINDSHTIGRLDTNDTPIHDKRLSGSHCKIERVKKDNGEYTYYVHDLSSNGSFINDLKIGKGGKKEVQNGDTLQILSSKVVPPQEVIAYVFTLSGAIVGKSKAPQTDIEIKRQKIDDAISDEMKCCICMEIIYMAVTTMPCLHNFCGGCFSLWMKKSQDCPQCRKQVMEVKKNPTLNNLIEKYVEAHPEAKKSAESMSELQKANIITTDVVKVSEEKKAEFKGKKKGLAKSRKMVDRNDSDFNSDGSVSDKDTSAAVVTKRLEKCETCKKNIGTNEGSDKCLFCGYTQHMSCKQKGRKIDTVASFSIQGIPVDCFNNNKEEQKILSTYIATNKIKMTELYIKLTNDMETNKWTFKNSK